MLNAEALTDVSFSLSAEPDYGTYEHTLHKLDSLVLWLRRYGHILRSLELHPGACHCRAMQGVASHLLGHCLGAATAAAGLRPLRLEVLEVDTLIRPSLFAGLPASLTALTLRSFDDEDDYLKHAGRELSTALPRLKDLQHLELEWPSHAHASTSTDWLQGMTGLTKLTSCILRGMLPEVQIAWCSMAYGT